MQTHISSITATFNGQRGGFDLVIVHLPEGAIEQVEETSHHLMMQGVETALADFRRKFSL